MYNQSPDQTLDCIGLFCPEPLFQTRQQLDTMKVGEVLEVLADDPAAEEDISRFVKRTGHEIIKFEKKNDHIRFLIKKSQ
jgi:tRNA 2-thiouridine synthesizing protein A